MAKLADAQVSGSCGQPCGFKSRRPHQKIGDTLLGVAYFSIRTNTKGFEGGSRFAGAKRFALRQLDNDKLDGKGRH